jgi:hypothetical protein
VSGAGFAVPCEIGFADLDEVDPVSGAGFADLAEVDP